MVATVNVVRGTGAGPSWGTVTNVRLRTDDANTQDTTNPIPIPGVGSLAYSFWASIALDLGATFTKINNVRHYSGGDINWALGTDGKLLRGSKTTTDKGCPDASYDQATGTAGTTGDNMDDVTNGHSYYKSGTSNYAAPADVNSDVVGSPCQVDSGDHTTPERTKHLALQLKVDDDATNGALTAKTLTWKWDEI